MNYFVQRSAIKTAEKKFKFRVDLPRHPYHPKEKNFGDPRKSWCYDCLETGTWAAFDRRDAWSDTWTAFDQGDAWSDLLVVDKIYLFANEADALMFRLKWG